MENETQRVNIVLSIQVDRKQFISLNKYSFNFFSASDSASLWTASSASMLSIASAGEYEVCFHNKKGLPWIWMETLKATISWSRRSNEFFGPEIAREIFTAGSASWPVYRNHIECLPHSDFICAEFMYVHFDISHLCERSKWSQSNARCIFYAIQKRSEEWTTESKNVKVRTKRWKRWLDTNIVTQKCTNKL